MVVEITVQQLSAPPPSMRQKVPSISVDMEEVVLKALAKDPLQRFASIEAFASALEQAMTPTVHLSRLEPAPVSGQPPVPSNNPPFTGRELSSLMLSGPYEKTVLTSTD